MIENYRNRCHVKIQPRKQLQRDTGCRQSTLSSKICSKQKNILKTAAIWQRVSYQHSTGCLTLITDCQTSVIITTYIMLTMLHLCIYIYMYNLSTHLNLLQQLNLH